MLGSITRDPIFCSKAQILLQVKNIVFRSLMITKYTTMLYQWQLVKNKVLQSNFPGNFHDKISLRISLLQEELKNVVIYNYK
jgi:hypothetical protein